MNYEKSDKLNTERSSFKYQQKKEKSLEVTKLSQVLEVRSTKIDWFNDKDRD